MKKTLLGLWVIVALCFVQNVQAQGTKIQILNANTFELEQRGQFKVKKLIGDVGLKQDNTILRCDSAYLFDETNFVEAYNHVHIIHNDSVHFYGDILKYDGQKKLARLEKNVSMVDKQSSLTSNELEFDLQQNKASYFNGGKLLSGTSVLTSKVGYYYTATKELFFKRNVLLVSPDFTMTTDTLKYHTLLKNATFYSNTLIVSDFDTIYCSSGSYNTERQSGVLKNRVRIVSKESTLIADTVIYDRKNRYSKALGNIILIDTLNKTTVFGGVAELFGMLNYSYVTINPIVISSVDHDSMMITADTIFTYQKTKKIGSKELIKAYPRVKIYKSDLQSVCDSLVYNKSDSVMILYKSPVLWSDVNQITGDTIIFYINTRKLDSMDVIGNSFVISQETKVHYNQIKGRLMTAQFKNQKINSIYVKGNGQSVYYAKEDSAFIGVNVIDCSEMNFRFINGKISTAQFITEPDAVFYAMNEMKPEELRIKGFKWLLRLRPKRFVLKSSKM